MRKTRIERQPLFVCSNSNRSRFVVRRRAQWISPRLPVTSSEDGRAVDGNGHSASAPFGFFYVDADEWIASESWPEHGCFPSSTCSYFAKRRNHSGRFPQTETASLQDNVHIVPTRGARESIRQNALPRRFHQVSVA